ncbi:MBL fold metallo-hydrolase [Bradyrhizobium sp. UFLA05-153]
MFRRFTETVFGYIADNGLSNVYGIEGRRSVTLIDSTTHTYYATRIARDITQRICKPIGQIIYTHFHRDHVLGAESFGATQGIVCHARCAARIVDHGAAMQDELGPAFASCQIVAPSITLTRDEGIIETEAGALPFARVGGHSDDSLILWSADGRVLFAADTVFNRVPPYIGRWSCIDGFGRVNDWIAALRRVLDERSAQVVSGHGPPATRADVEDLLRFFEYYAARVEEGIRQGLGLREIWFGIYRRDGFLRCDVHPEVYLHMVTALHEEWTRPPSFKERQHATI